MVGRTKFVVIENGLGWNLSCHGLGEGSDFVWEMVAVISELQLVLPLDIILVCLCLALQLHFVQGEEVAVAVLNPDVGSDDVEEMLAPPFDRAVVQLDLLFGTEWVADAVAEEVLAPPFDRGALVLLFDRERVAKAGSQEASPFDRGVAGDSRQHHK